MYGKGTCFEHAEELYQVIICEVKIFGEILTIMKVTPLNIKNATKNTSKKNNANEALGVIAHGGSKSKSIAGDKSNTGISTIAISWI